MSDAATPLETALEAALGAAHLALRQLEAAEPSAATLPAARSVRRAIGALLDAIDDRAPCGGSIDRATATLTFALAALGGAEGVEEGADGDPVENADSGAASLWVEGVARAAAAAAHAGRLVPADRRDRPPLCSPDRARPRWRVATAEPRLVDIPRASLLPPDALRLPPELLEPELATDAAGGATANTLPGLDERALLAQAAQLGQDAARLEASTLAAADGHVPFGERPKGDLEVGSLMVADAEAPITDLAFRRRVAREHFEDIGMFGLQRMPLFGDDWQEVETIEARLLASCDALLADPIALRDLERLARDTPAPDPMRVFAMAFVGATLEGRDGLAAAERTLYAHDPHDAGIAEAFATALAMSPNPLALRVLVSLSRAEEGAVRAAAIRAMAARGPVDVALLVEAAESASPLVIAAALPALATARHPHAAELLAQVVVRERGSVDPRVALAVWEALALARDASAGAAPRAHLASELGDRASIALAIVASEDDAAALLATAISTPSPARLVALGWAGSLRAVPLLLASLADDALGLAAARALERLLGTTALEATEIDPESLETMEPLAVRTPSLLPRGPLVQAMLGEDDDADGSPDTLHLPHRDASLWQKRYGEVQSALPRGGQGLKVRRGQAYLPALSLAELGATGAALPASFAERQLLVRELSFRTGHAVVFSSEDLVVVQRKKLIDCRSLLSAPATAGSFQLAGARSMAGSPSGVVVTGGGS